MCVNDHDFRFEAIGVTIPYGIYDPLANRGLVFIAGMTQQPLPPTAIADLRSATAPTGCRGGNRWRTGAWNTGF